MPLGVMTHVFVYTGYWYAPVCVLIKNDTTHDNTYHTAHAGRAKVSPKLGSRTRPRSAPSDTVAASARTTAADGRDRTGVVAKTGLG